MAVTCLNLRAKVEARPSAGTRCALRKLALKTQRVQAARLSQYLFPARRSLQISGELSFRATRKDFNSCTAAPVTVLSRTASAHVVKFEAIRSPSFSVITLHIECYPFIMTLGKQVHYRCGRYTNASVLHRVSISVQAIRLLAVICAKGDISHLIDCCYNVSLLPMNQVFGFLSKTALAVSASNHVPINRVCNPRSKTLPCDKPFVLSRRLRTCDYHDLDYLFIDR